MSSVLNHSRTFARSLKTYGNIEYRHNPQETVVVSIQCITKFNTKEFQNKCNPVSTNYDSSINFDDVASELFKEGEIWSSRDKLLNPAMEELANFHGFNIVKVKTAICCNQRGKGGGTTRHYIQGDLSCDCPFGVKLQALSKTRYKAKPKSRKWCYQFNWNAPVIISKAMCGHGLNCTPGKQNRIITGQRGGKYVEKLPTNTLYTLCNFLEKNGSINSDLILQIIEPVWPKSKNVTKHDCWNMRICVNRLMPIYKATDGNYDKFKEVVNANDLLDGIDNAPTLDNVLGF